MKPDMIKQIGIHQVSYVYMCVCMHAHTYMYGTIMIKEKETINLKVKRYGRGLREGLWEGLEIRKRKKTVI